MFEALVIAWIIFGLLAGAIGASRNVGFAIHALIGFLFGPIGVLTALLFKPTDEDKYRRRGSASGFVKCPYCAELVKAEAQICKHCGNHLSREEQVPTATAVAPSETGSYRGYQIETYSDHFKVEGERFDTIEDAKKWIDHFS